MKHKALAPVLTSLAVLAPLLTPASALAHGGADGGLHHGFSHGLSHPFTGLDHLAAMVAVGAWSALAVRPMWRAPLAFLALLTVGGLAGLAGVAVPAIEPMIAASLLVLGLLVAMRRQMPWGVAAGLVGVFAFFHGAAHGLELSGGSSSEALGTLLGMVLGSALLHGAGMLLGEHVLRSRRWVSVLAGVSTVLLGAGLLARLA